MAQLKEAAAGPAHRTAVVRGRQPHGRKPEDTRKRVSVGAVIIFAVAALYFLIPLITTFLFSLRGKKDVVGFSAYERVFADPKFANTFLFSLEMAVLTIVFGLILIVPTTVWVHLKLPKLKPTMDFIAMLPFVIPPIVLVFGLIRLYSAEPLPLVSSPLLLVAGYVVLSFPYIHSSVNAGLSAIDVKRLVEAAQSLGAGWFRILLTVIVPNLRAALMSAVFLTFAIVMGELTLAVLLAWPAFGPYMAQMGRSYAYEPAALAILSFVLTWLSIVAMQVLSRGFGPRAKKEL